MGIITSDVTIIAICWAIMTVSLITLSVAVAFRIANGERQYDKAWRTYNLKMRNRFYRRSMFDPVFTKGWEISWATLQRRPSKKTIMFRGMMRRLYAPMFDCLPSMGYFGRPVHT